jgi:hypothetical protein
MLAVWIGGASAASNSTSIEPLSNSLLSVVGAGTNLGIVSVQGLNFTESAFADSIRWKSIRRSDIDIPAGYGEGRYLAALLPPEQNYGQPSVGALWSVPPGADKGRKIPLSYDLNSLWPRGEEDTLEYDARAIGPVDIEYAFGVFWVAMYDGGLLRLEFGDYPAPLADLYYPGDSTSYSFAEFAPPAIPLDAEKARRVVAIEADTVSGTLWIGCQDALWRFTPAASGSDDRWEKISATGDGPSSLLDISLRPSADDSPAASLYASGVAKQDDGSDTLVYHLSLDSKQWQPLELYRPETPQLLLPAGEDFLYIVHGGQLALYRHRDNALQWRGDFVPRMRNEDLLSFEIRDVLLTHDNGEDHLWVATSQGLLHTGTGVYDPAGPEKFHQIHRSPTVSGGTKGTYAYPSIINSRESGESYSRAVFAHNMPKGEKITVDVFDWNMDHVIRLDDNSWDGTLNNSGGTAVAPGVYYYRISTDNGHRAFGKVIVAKK